MLYNKKQTKTDDKKTAKHFISLDRDLCCKVIIFCFNKLKKDR